MVTNNLADTLMNRKEFLYFFCIYCNCIVVVYNNYVLKLLVLNLLIFLLIVYRQKTVYALLLNFDLIIHL